ncbi:MAG: M3 family metallopeptidase, partial [bacterium]|nr:M3 family metallopeptidase [bacterium]
MKKTEKKIKWNLKQLYKDSKDPQIEMDIRAVEMAYDNFIMKYKDKDDYLKDENALQNAMKDYENMYKDLCIAKPYLYFAYRKDLNSKDADAEAKMNLIAERFTKNENRLIFFTNKLAKLSVENKEKFLKSEILKPYHYYLKVLFQHGDYMLSEPEEKILNLKAQPSHALWVQGLEKVASRLTVKWKGKDLPISEAVSMISSLPTKDRYKLDAEVIKVIKNVSDFAESEVNAVVIDKKIEDDLRGFKKAYSGTVIGYQNEEETVENLIKTVSDNYKIAHRFYTLKAKLLGLNKLKYCDRAAPVGKTSTQIKFKEAVDIIRKAFAKFNPTYSDTFDYFIKNKQIDVYPEIGKTGGAYCSSAQNMPTFVLLNYTNRLRDVTTMAHEMGHAIHAKLSFENQPTLYRDHTISTAEVASTLFENFVFDEILPTLPRKEQIVMLHDKINDE